MKGISPIRFLVSIAVAGSLLSCGGGGGGGESRSYEFGGRWVWNAVIVTSNVPGNDVGDRFTDILIISQFGDAITVTFGSTGDSLIMRGACDPAARTFRASGVSTGEFPGVRVDISGNGVDQDSMSGTEIMSMGGGITGINWTADLSSRSLAVAPAGSGRRTMADILKGSPR